MNNKFKIVSQQKYLKKAKHFQKEMYFFQYLIPNNQITQTLNFLSKYCLLINSHKDQEITFYDSQNLKLYKQLKNQRPKAKTIFIQNNQACIQLKNRSKSSELTFPINPNSPKLDLNLHLQQAHIQLPILQPQNTLDYQQILFFQPHQNLELKILHNLNTTSQYEHINVFPNHFILQIKSQTRRPSFRNKLQNNLNTSPKNLNLYQISQKLHQPDLKSNNIKQVLQTRLNQHLN